MPPRRRVRPSVLWTMWGRVTASSPSSRMLWFLPRLARRLLSPSSHLSFWRACKPSRTYLVSGRRGSSAMPSSRVEVTWTRASALFWPHQLRRSPRQRLLRPRRSLRRKLLSRTRPRTRPRTGPRTGPRTKPKRRPRRRRKPRRRRRKEKRRPRARRRPRQRRRKQRRMKRLMMMRKRTLLTKDRRGRPIFSSLKSWTMLRRSRTRSFPPWCTTRDGLVGTSRESSVW
mmetsp:Transcript_34100/g.96029  ORF Transcript_34100/g.96029 Transcript_34100/m.96029 type:complete len:228 (+) Transcript_34100:7461-8144(+)